MTDPPSPNRRGPLLGRSVLFGSAYAPASLIVGCRLLPHWYAWGVIAAGILGITSWGIFLVRLKARQPREVALCEVQSGDSEVTAYIASYLLPILAAPSPTTGDIAAYLLCASLILVVAFAADLGSVNPVVYLLGCRVVRARIAGQPVIILARKVPQDGKSARVAQAAGVVMLLDRE